MTRLKSSLTIYHAGKPYFLLAFGSRYSHPNGVSLIPINTARYRDGMKTSDFGGIFNCGMSENGQYGIKGDEAEFRERWCMIVSTTRKQGGSVCRVERSRLSMPGHTLARLEKQLFPIVLDTLVQLVLAMSIGQRRFPSKIVVDRPRQ